MLIFVFRFHDINDEMSTVVFATPQMLEVLSESIFVEADVTFPGITTFPYLLNIVAYNHLTIQFQVVARVLMSNLSAEAYKLAFDKVFSITTNLHPEFNHGAEVKGWILDFSSAQYQGLAQTIGEKASEVIRGCEVHFMRVVKKIADKVTKDEVSKKIFKKIAYNIPRLDNQSDVLVSFDILSGVAEIAEASSFLSLNEEELAASTTGWVAAEEWAEWWSRPRHVKMFTRSFKEMTDADWLACPRTTNAVESHNKISNAKTSLLICALEHYYRIDKRSAYQTLAAQLGVAVGTKAQKRKRLNDKRRTRRLRAKKRHVEGEDEVDSTDETLLVSSKTADVNEADDDEHIGKKVWIDTIGSRGKHLGWCEAVIKEKQANGDYVAFYTKWPKHATTIPDIYDEDEIRFVSPFPEGQ